MVDEQTTAAEEPGADAAEPSPLEQAKAMVGARLDELGGGTVGRIEGVLADAVDGSPTWLVVRLGRLGRRSAVPFELAVAGAGHVWEPYPRDAIRAASGIDPVQGLTCAEERSLADHFGTPEGAGRLAAIAGRGDDDAGSVPA